jgi:MFS family permease
MSGLDYNVSTTKPTRSTDTDHEKVALAILYPFYVAAEIPSNLMMKLTRPSIWLPTTMVAWGVCSALMGLCTSFAGLLVARSALGFAEGGLFPGINFL